MHFNIKQYDKRAQQTMEELAKELGGTIVSDGHPPYMYKDNNSNVLAIVHLDSVQKYAPATYANPVEEETAPEKKLWGQGPVHKPSPTPTDIAISPVFDDRLGLYAILDVLPKLIGPYDILLSTDEEIGRPTSHFYTPKENKKHNWMFQFDRALDDVACYQYLPIAASYVDSVNLTPTRGTFSDICCMSHLNICGFNFGVGYGRNCHSPETTCNIPMFDKQMNTFAKFYTMYKDTPIHILKDINTPPVPIGLDI